LDINKKLSHKIEINNIDLDSPYKIGLIIGASGSGKTTLAKHLFGEDCFKNYLDLSKPVIEQFPSEFSYSDCTDYLTAIGLSQVPCWIKPAFTLSNGQRNRAECAMAIASGDFSIIDEWTSVVDRNTAKVMSSSLNKFIKNRDKKIVILSCHYDIVEWLKPDWIIDCNKQTYTNYRGSLWPKPEPIQFDIREMPNGRSWKNFSKYHYLGENLPGGTRYVFGLFYKNEQIGFNCFANYAVGRQNIFHFNRTVIHPDWCGFGLGIRFVNETSRIVKEKYNKDIRGKFSSIPMMKALSKDPKWLFVKKENNTKKVMRAGERSLVTTYSFKYIG